MVTNQWLSPWILLFCPFQEGTAIGALELFASLVEHMARWAEALGDSFGLCMLEADGTAGRPFWNP